MADIFVSYTSSDRDWAIWVAAELKALGHTPYVHEWEIGAGADIYAWMEQRHNAADHVLCVVSDEYLKAPYSTLERNAAQWQAAKNRPGFVLLVVVKQCHLPTLSDHLRRCELFGVPEETARRRFRDFMAKREAPETAAFPGKVVAVSNIAVHVPEHFMGRDDALAVIEQALGRYEGRVAITALHGLRGVGKTVLAAVYAERHRGDYRATWWLRAESEAGIRADLVGLGVRLGWVAPDEKEEPALEAVMERLRHEGDGILLIYDNALNADAIRPYLPRGGGAKIIVTSNAHAWRGVAEPVEIRLWPKEIGADFLIARTGRTAERDAAEDLSETLGGLPLAHEQAAAYCERLGVSFAEYIRRFEATPAKMLDAETDAPAEYHDRLTVAKTFALAIEEAAKLHPAAEPLLVHAALLAPEPIPLFLFAEARVTFENPSDGQRFWKLWRRPARSLGALLAGDGLEEAVAALRAFALVERETIPDERDAAIVTDTIRLHRLVRQVAASRCDGTARAARLGVLILAVASVYPGGVYNNPAVWPRARRLDALALALVNDETVLPQAELIVARILNGLESYRHGALAAYAEARKLAERALAISETALGPDHPSTATSLNNLAALLRAQGDFAAARPLYERAVAIREKALGPDHPETAASLGNLAGCLDALGQVTEAEALHRRALEAQIRRLGRDHQDVLRGQNYLAHSLRQGGHPDLAERYARDCAEATVRTLGDAQPLTVHRRNNLALTLVMLRRTDEARSVLAASWAAPCPPRAIVTPAIAFLAMIAALLDGAATVDPLGRLRSLLLGPALERAPDVAHPWDVGYLIDYLSDALPPRSGEFLAALLAAINDPSLAPALDRFPEWRDTSAVPLDTPWPSAGVSFRNGAIAPGGAH